MINSLAFLFFFFFGPRSPIGHHATWDLSVAKSCYNMGCLWVVSRKLTKRDRPPLLRAVLISVTNGCGILPRLEWLRSMRTCGDGVSIEEWRGKRAFLSCLEGGMPPNWVILPGEPRSCVYHRRRAFDTRSISHESRYGKRQKVSADGQTQSQKR